MGQRDKEHVEKREWWRRGVLAAIAKADFSASMMAVAFYISFKINSDSKICWTSQETIAEAVGMKEITVRTLIAQLRKRGFLAVDRAKRTTSNRYVLALEHVPIWPRIVSSNSGRDRSNSIGRGPNNAGVERSNSIGRDRSNNSGPTDTILSPISLSDHIKILTPPSFSMNLADDRSSNTGRKEAFEKDARLGGSQLSTNERKARAAALHDLSATLGPSSAEAPIDVAALKVRAAE